MRFFATAAKGTEPALRDELRELRFPRVRADRGGVHFEGDMSEGARASLWSRVAARVLLEVATFDAPSGEALYEGVREVDWSAWLTPRTTLSVRATARSSALTHTQFIAQKTKDAVVDRLRDRFGERPDVDREDADVLLTVHLAKDRATVYLDVGGGALHERGYRARGGAAPLRETLAAAIVRLSGWDRQRPFVDPMCGTGAVAIEADGWARQIAPGLSRRQLGLERWASHGEAERRVLAAVREEARSKMLSEGPPVFGSDADAHTVEVARMNAADARGKVTFTCVDVRELSPLVPPGFVVTNPPYGERLDATAGFYDALARKLSSLRGHTVAILAGNPAVLKPMRREPARWWILFNGPIECRLQVYEIPG